MHRIKRVTGYAMLVEPERPTIERDTITCFHCQRVVFVKPGSAATVFLIYDRSTGRWIEEAGAFCRVCMRPICLHCHDLGRCLPWERQLEASEARDRFRRSAGL